MVDRDKAETPDGTDLESLRRTMLDRAHQRGDTWTYTAAHTTYASARSAAKRYRGYRTVMKITGATNTGQV